MTRETVGLLLQMRNRKLTKSVQMLKENYKHHVLAFNFKCCNQEKNLLSDRHTQICLPPIDECAKLAYNLFDCGGKQSEANPNQQAMRLHQGYKRLKVNKRTVVHLPQEGSYENASPCKWAEMKCAGRKGSHKRLPPTLRQIEMRGRCVHRWPPL